MGALGTLFKFVVSIAFDVADFYIGRIPIWGTVFDIFGGFLGLYLWGVPGGAQFLEIIDITDQIDGFIPTLTLAGLFSLLTRK